MATTRINFGEWLPDQPSIIQAVSDAVNCYPVANGYAPIPNIEPYPNDQTQISGDDDLLACFGGKYGGQNTLFAASASKIFKFDTTNNSYVDVSKSGGYSASSWDVTQFGSVVIAADGSAKLQAFDLGSSTAFADLSADAPIAKFVTVVRDFVVAANVAGEESKVYWSDINNETVWTPSLAAQADAQVLPDGGDITGIAGGEYGLIFLEKAIYRMTYAGSPFFFQFDAISRSLGCIANGSIAQLSGVTYFLADDGFYACNGQTVTPIGTEKVDRWFFDVAAPDQIATGISATADPERSLIIWAFPTPSGNKLLIYSQKLNRWSYSNINVKSVSYAVTASASLEALDRLSITQGTNTLAGTYTRTTTTVTVTANNHGLNTNAYVYFDATSGGAADGFYQITKVDDNSFTFTTVASGSISTSNCTLSLPSIDAASITLDDRAYAGGTWFLAAVYGQKVYGFTGDFAEASVTTNDIDIGRSLLTLVKPIVDNGSGDVAVSGRVLLQDNVTFTDYASPDSINRVSVRSSGNYHRVKVRPTGSNWRTVVAVDVDVTKAGDR